MAADVDEATVARALEPAVVEVLCALGVSVQAPAEAVATGNEATDASISEPAVVESAGAAPATTLVDPVVSPPAASLPIPETTQEQVVAGPHADQARDSTFEQEGAVLSPMAAPSQPRSRLARRCPPGHCSARLANSCRMSHSVGRGPSPTLPSTVYSRTSMADRWWRRGPCAIRASFP